MNFPAHAPIADVMPLCVYPLHAVHVIGLYDVHIHLRKWPMLEGQPEKVVSYQLRVSHVMTRNPVAFKSVRTCCWFAAYACWLACCVRLPLHPSSLSLGGGGLHVSRGTSLTIQP